jgi:hypothetical protein
MDTMPRLNRLTVLCLLALSCQPSFELIWCERSDNCPNGFVCDVSASRCVLADAGVVGGGAAGGSAGGAMSGGTAGSTAGGDAGGTPGAGGMAGGTAGGSSGGMPTDCQRDLDCGQPSACNVPTCSPQGRCVGRPLDAGTPCRMAAGACDEPEACDGVSTECPMDVVTMAGRACGPDAGLCEVPSTCDGQTPTCPALALRDAGAICRQLDVCLPPQRCSGSTGQCPPVPFDAGARCDDQNDCSAGLCQATGCTFARVDSLVTRGLLQGRLDGGLTVLPVPRGATFTTGGGFLAQFNTTVCPAAFAPPECAIEVDLSFSNFGITSSPMALQGSGSVRLRAPLIRMTTTATGVGAPPSFTWGAAFGRGGCSNGLPANVPFISVPFTYSFRPIDPDGGTIGPIQLTNLRSAILNTLLVCPPPSSLGLMSSVVNDLVNDAQNVVSQQLAAGIQTGFEAAIRQQLCLRPFRGSCAQGTPNVAGLCVDDGGVCFSAHHFREAIPTIPACVP